ncbi:MAG: GTPase Era [Alphaproteobacteria bacterium]|nr:GTPase Era [Alphaproteobacteria bacterium]
MTATPATASEALAGTRCGFVAVLGAPNAGKSTLVNRLVGAKVSIVSPKVQTTRTRVTAIGMAGNAQIVFLDTPGIFQGPRKRLERAMVDAAWRSAKDADVLLLVVDAARKRIDPDTRQILDALRARGQKAVLALNKIDLVRKETLLAKADALFRSGAISDVFMISATEGDGVDALKAHLVARLPLGPWHYPEDQLTDMPERLLAAEVTREQLFLRLYQEMPYSIAVETETWEEFKDGSAKVSQVIYVERESQRPIVLGKGGATIKAIGEAARKELQDILGRKIHLALRVKQREDWSESRELYKEWGLEWDA